MGYKIEKGIPIEWEYSSKYPWRGMEIGDSFFVPPADFEGKKTDIVYTLRTAAYCFSRKNPEFRFTVSKQGDGIRVWRVGIEINPESYANLNSLETLEHKEKLIRLAEKIARLLHGWTISRENLTFVLGKVMEIRKL